MRLPLISGPVKIGIARSTGIASTAVGLPPVFPACFVTRAHMRKFGDVVDLSDLLRCSEDGPEKTEPLAEKCVIDNLLTQRGISVSEDK